MVFGIDNQGTAYRQSMIADVQNQAVREFWLTEFNRWNDRDRTQYIASLQNKLGAFILDEFQSFLIEGNTTMADALDESRKYRTSDILATQMLDQLDTATLSGVLGNCGSTLCMTLGPRDAETLTDLLGHGLTLQDLMQTPKYHAYLRLLTDGATKTFSMTTLRHPASPNDEPTPPAGSRVSGTPSLRPIDADDSRDRQIDLWQTPLTLPVALRRRRSLMIERCRKSRPRTSAC